MLEFPRLLSLAPRGRDDLPFLSSNNVSVYQVYQFYPSLQPLYPFQWERDADLTEFMKWAEQRPSFAWIVMSVYVVVVLLYNYWRGTKKWSPTKLKKSQKARPSLIQAVLTAWNFVLSFLSLMGVLRIAPQVGYFLSDGLSGWQLLLDDAEPIAGHGACGFWMTLFVYLKFVELIDTLFLMLRDRRVTFLHGYHHATVLVFCWMCYIHRPAVGIIFTLMNNCVHAIMYLYYGLTAIGFHPRWSIGVTFIQIMQMVIGKMLCGGIAYLHWTGHPEMTIERAKRTLAISVVGTVIYVSYFYLFASFFVHRYMGAQKKSFKLDKIKVV